MDLNNYKNVIYLFIYICTLFVRSCVALWGLATGLSPVQGVLPIVYRVKKLQKRQRSLIIIICGLVVRVPGCRSRGPGSIPGATRFSEK
jgi:hypothetical protein